jgi:hypothetical protein
MWASSKGRPPSSLHRNISTVAAHSVRSRETPHFAFTFAVVVAVHLHLLFSCHPSPQAEDLLLAFAVVVAGRIGIRYALPFQPQTMRLKYNHSKAICRPG